MSPIPGDRLNEPWAQARIRAAVLSMFVSRLGKCSPSAGDRFGCLVQKGCVRVRRQG